MQKHYTIKDSSKLLGIKVRTVREWIKTGKLKAVKYPNCNMWFIPQDEIIRITGGDINANED